MVRAKKKTRQSGAAKRAEKRAVEERLKADLARLRAELSKDRDWVLATGPTAEGRYRESDRAIVRLTKKAVRLLYPQYRCSVTRDRGTAHGWVSVNLFVPEIAEHDGSARGRARELEAGRAITGRVSRTLDNLGLRYAQYLPDCIPGLDEMTNCVTVTVNGWG